MAPESAPVQATAASPSLVALAVAQDRARGVAAVLKHLGHNPVAGQDVLLKPNLNTADPCPGSSHNDTLAALIEALWDMGAASITLGERSYHPTRQVLQQKGLPPLLDRLGVATLVFDDLPEKDWVEVRPAHSHWPQGFRVARPVLESPCLVSTCCLKTHQYGGVFTMSLKLHVGVLPGGRQGFPYMKQLHDSPHQRLMIAELNQPFRPALILLDGLEAFVSGGPMEGQRARAGVFLASAGDRVALDAVGVALLKLLGSTPEIMGRPVFAQEQISRAAQLGLGAARPGDVAISAPDAAGQDLGERLRGVLDQED
ncbi:MAG: DUF362 domain-containing protein [Desulfarculus sp.]|nr:DUF362 domain-containing protein [Desulfarculus sp.]